MLKADELRILHDLVQTRLSDGGSQVPSMSPTCLDILASWRAISFIVQATKAGLRLIQRIRR
jgi:hypothetical protein